jgi:predicted ATPase
MIKEVKVRYLKMFEDETFNLSDHILLAGPNNSGKSTLLQAIMIWNLALSEWNKRRGRQSGSKAKERTGIPLARKDFTAIPLREMNMLWTDTQTGLRKEELEKEQKSGQPRVLEIIVKGKSLTNRDWSLGFELRYGTTEQIYVKPILEEGEKIPDDAECISVVYIPPFSGIGSEETKYDRPYQDLLIGQGKGGDILRNLLYEIYHQEKTDNWDALRDHINKIFGYTLKDPEYEGRPYIQCDYFKHIVRNNRKSSVQLDIASAGSGFHQVLLILAFFYARPSTVILLDEPDAHLHVILQKQIYDAIRRIANERNSQLIIATHSEILIDGTAPERILSFYQKPHLLIDESQKDQIMEAIKRLPSMDILSAEHSGGVLYVEGETDFDLLKAWARVLIHPLYKWMSENTFWHSNQGRHPKEARGHFFALLAIKPQIKGVLLLDGDNRKLPDHEISAEGLSIIRWKRYESESYLIHPQALERFISNHALPMFVQNAMEYFQSEIPPAVYKNPKDEHDYFTSTPASKTLLPNFFNRADYRMPKSEYYLVAEQMRPEEICDDVISVLDQIYSIVVEKKMEEEK